MMNEATVRQRIKYVLEHGEAFPGEKPATRPLMVKLSIVIIALQIADIATDFLKFYVHNCMR